LPPEVLQRLANSPPSVQAAVLHHRDEDIWNQRQCYETETLNFDIMYLNKIHYFCTPLVACCVLHSEPSGGCTITQFVTINSRAFYALWENWKILQWNVVKLEFSLKRMPELMVT
jgi:hypothetical protein